MQLEFTDINTVNSMHNYLFIIFSFMQCLCYGMCCNNFAVAIFIQFILYVPDGSLYNHAVLA